MAKKKNVITMSVSPEIHDRLLEAKRDTGFSISIITRKCIEQVLDDVVAKLKVL